MVLYSLGVLVVSVNLTQTSHRRGKGIEEMAASDCPVGNLCGAVY